MSPVESAPGAASPSPGGSPPAGPRGSERLSAFTGAVLIVHALNFVTGFVKNGGWGFAIMGMFFGYFAVPVLALVAAVLAIVTWRRRSHESIALALLLVAAVVAFDVFLMTSRDFDPGPAINI
jgi:hypothetical protein